MNLQEVAVNRRIVIVVASLAVFAIGLLAYRYVINLPFRIDDFVHFRLLTSHILADVWLGQAGFAYYRPLPFTIWKVISMIMGGYRYPPEVLHAINVGLHALNGVLVLALVYLIQSRSMKGIVLGSAAAILFLIFPFSYQAVPWVGAMMHPLATLLMLVSIVSAIVAHDKQSRALYIVSLSTAIFAPLAHETGVLTACGLTLALLTSGRVTRPRQLISKTWPYWVITLVVIGSFIGTRLRSVSAAPGLDFESRIQNAVYFLQGLAYPISPFATRLMSVIPGLTDLGAVLLSCSPVVLLLVIVFIRVGQGRLVVFALGWFVFMITPAWLLLSFSYVVDGPRLLYEASVGAALFWTIPLAILFDHWTSLKTSGKRYVLAIPVAALLAGTVVGSAGFLTERADMYEQTRLATIGLLQVSTQPFDDKRNILSVNFPGWIAPKVATYAQGHEGVSFVPEYSSPIDLVWTMTGVDSPMYNAVVTELQTRWRFNFLNYGSRWELPDLQPQLRIARQVLFTVYRGDDLATYSAGYLEGEKATRVGVYIASYDDKLALRSGEWRITPAGLLVTLHWQSWVTVTQDVRTYVHLVNVLTGEMAAQEDGLPLMGLSNPVWWIPGDRWVDTRLVILPRNIKPGNYALWVGIYPANGSPRLHALDSAGQRLSNDEAAIGTVTIP